MNDNVVTSDYFCLGLTTDEETRRLKEKLLNCGLPEELFETYTDRFQTFGNEYKLVTIEYPWLYLNLTFTTFKAFAQDITEDIKRHWLKLDDGTELAKVTFKKARQGYSTLIQNMNGALNYDLEVVIENDNWGKVPSEVVNKPALLRNNQQSALKEFKQLAKDKLYQKLGEFKTEHAALFKAESRVCLFGGFRRTFLPVPLTLDTFLEHVGQSKMTRSKRLGMTKGWLTEEGKLANTAPASLRLAELVKDYDFKTLKSKLQDSLDNTDLEGVDLFKELGWIDDALQLTSVVPKVIKDSVVERQQPVLSEVSLK